MEYVCSTLQKNPKRIKWVDMNRDKNDAPIVNYSSFGKEGLVRVVVVLLDQNQEILMEEIN